MDRLCNISRSVELEEEEEQAFHHSRLSRQGPNCLGPVEILRDQSRFS